MAYRKETFHSQLSGIDEFSSDIAAPSPPSGKNWWYTKNRQVTKRPGSLSVDTVPPTEGYNGLISYLPTSPAILNSAVASTSYKYNSDHRLSYITQTLIAPGAAGSIYRIRPCRAGLLTFPATWHIENRLGVPYIVNRKSDGTTLSAALNSVSSVSAALTAIGASSVFSPVTLNATGQSPYSFTEPKPYDGYYSPSVYLVDRVPSSLVTSNTTTSPNYTYKSRSFVVRDSNITGTNFNGILYLAGQGIPLIAYDGCRYSMAGAVYTNPYAITKSAGGLTGSYTYILRPKLYRPNGSVSYGRTSTVTTSLAGEQATFSASEVTLRSVAEFGTSTSTVPRRLSVMRAAGPLVSAGSGYYRLDALDYNYNPSTTLQPGDCLFFQKNPSNALQSLQVGLVSPDPHSAFLIANLSLGAQPTLAYGDIFTLGESVEIFRNQASGSTYYLVAEVPLGASYTDNTADGTLITQGSYTALAYDPGPVPQVTTCVTTHQNRICVTAGYPASFPGNSFESVGINANFSVDTLAYSQPNTDEFPSDNTVIFPLDAGDAGLTAIFSHDDLLYVASEKSTWLIQGDLSSAESFTVEKMSVKSGIISNTGFGAINGMMMALGNEGVYALSGRSVDKEIGYPIKDILNSVPYESRVRATVAVHENYWILGIPAIGEYKFLLYGSNTLQKYFENKASSLWLIYDSARKCWYKWTNLPSSGVASYDGYMWCVGRDNVSGVTRLTDLIPSDTLTAIDMQFKTNWQGNESAGQTKHFARAQIVAAGEETQNFGLRVRTESNWIENIYDQDTTVSFNDARGYGELPYATIPYGDANLTEQLIPIAKPKAKSMRMTLSNNDVNEKPYISGWTIELNDNADTVKDM